jgi:hypothetical protein
MRRPVLDESIDPSRAADGAADPTGWRLVDATRAALAEVIGGRRDIRKFRPDAVPEETLQHARVPGPEGRGRAGGAGRAPRQSTTEPGDARPMPTAFVVTGLPALLIILVILAIFVLGIVSLTKATARGARKLTDHDDGA